MTASLPPAEPARGSPIRAGMPPVATASATPRRAVPRIDPALREARTCYDHLAGRLGVALADALVARGAVALTQEAGEVTDSGRALLGSLGIALESPRGSRRLDCRPCLDWSERRPHLAGVLGAALLRRFVELGWLRRAPASRAVMVCAEGRRGLAATFGLRV